MDNSGIPFARRVYSGRGAHLDSLLTEVAARPELLRLVNHAKAMTDEELETLVDIIGRSSGQPAPARRRWHERVPTPALPVTLLAGAGALGLAIGLISVVLFLTGTVRAAG
jgi:hypothetical protein